MSRLISGRSRSGVLSVSEFERAFLLERARVDRSQKTFSLVVFVPHREDEEQEIRLVHALRNRLRIYDSIGRLDARRIGALLPETTADGAWTLADAVLERLAQMEIDLDCEVFSYPADWPTDGEPNVGDGLASPRDESKSESQSGMAAGAEGITAPSSEASALHLVEDVGLNGLARARGKRTARPVSDLRQLMTVQLPWWKRMMDILVSATLLLLLSPLLLLVALLVKLSSPGPVIFQQQRAGIGGKPFTFLKFRSMYIDAEKRRSELNEANEAAEGPIFKMKNDPRITPIGRILRRTSLDEVPQLVNVLRGDMTLVGPRPPLVDEVARYERWQHQRLDARGGLTCIWQVSGRSDIPFIEWVRMDLRYIAHRSFLFDLWLLARTAGAVLSRRGAY